MGGAPSALDNPNGPTFYPAVDYFLAITVRTYFSEAGTLGVRSAD